MISCEEMTNGDMLCQSCPFVIIKNNRIYCFCSYIESVLSKLDIIYFYHEEYQFDEFKYIISK